MSARESMGVASSEGGETMRCRLSCKLLRAVPSEAGCMRMPGDPPGAVLSCEGTSDAHAPPDENIGARCGHTSCDPSGAAVSQRGGDCKPRASPSEGGESTLRKLPCKLLRAVPSEAGGRGSVDCAGRVCRGVRGAGLSRCRRRCLDTRREALASASQLESGGVASLTDALTKADACPDDTTGGVTTGERVGVKLRSASPSSVPEPSELQALSRARELELVTSSPVHTTEATQARCCDAPCASEQAGMLLAELTGTERADSGTPPDGGADACAASSECREPMTPTQAGASPDGHTVEPPSAASSEAGGELTPCEPSAPKRMETCRVS